MVHTNDTFYLDETLYNGRPNDQTGRLPKEIFTYDLLDKLNISYQRVDHSPLPTIEACREVDALLEMEICKNLFLSKLAPPDSLLQNRHSWKNSLTLPPALFQSLGL